MSGKKLITTLGAVLIFAGWFGAVAVRADGLPITDGLVGRWMFNEASGIVASDSSGPYSGFNNDGMLVGSTLFTPDATRGNVLSVYGVSGQVKYAPTPDLQPATGTISLWLMPTDPAAAAVVEQTTDMLVSCNRTGSFTAYSLRLDKRGRAFAVISNDNPRTCKRSPQVQISTPNAAGPNQWTHLAMVWNGSTLYLYVNGKERSSASYVATPTTGLSYHGNFPLMVAANNPTSSTYVGHLSDLRMYSRALAPAEVEAIYNGQ